MQRFWEMVRWLFCAGLWALLPTLIGEDQVLIVAGKSGSEAEFRIVQRQIDTLVKELPSLGFSPDSIRVLTEESKFGSEELLAALREGGGGTATDRYWLFLFGSARRLKRGTILRLPRGTLNVQELSEALKKIPARQTVFCLTGGGYELQEALRAPTRITFSAYDTPDRSNPPMWTGEFLRRLFSPGDGWQELLRESVLANQRLAAERNILNQENPRLTCGDRVDVMPFAAILDSELTPRRKKALRRQPSHAENSDLKQHEPLTVLFRRVEIVTTAEGAATIREKRQLAIRTQERAEEFQTLRFPFYPGEEFTVESATIRRPGENKSEAVSLAPRSRLIRFANLVPGSVITYTVRRDIMPNRRTGNDQQIAPLLPWPQEKFELEISLPKETRAFLKCYGVQAQITQSEGVYNDSIRCEFNQLPAWDPPADLPSNAPVPLVQLSGWRSFEELAGWYRSIAADTDHLTEPLRAKAQQLTAGAKTPREKLKMLYDYLNMLRYDTSVLGIRSLRPRLPEHVIAEGYGDCKDKANALIVLARAVGITGELYLVNRGGYTDLDFPAWQFNHALTYFPEIDGGMWLDPTDTQTPFGTLPPGDRRRQALRVADGKFRTIETRGTPPDYFRSRVSGQTVFYETTGVFRHRLQHALKFRSPQKQREFLAEELSILYPGSGLQKVESSDDKLKLTLESPPAKFGLPTFLTAPFRLPERNVPLELLDGSSFTIELDLPGHTAVYQHHTPSVQVNLQAGHLRIDFKSGVVSPEDYPQIRTLLRELQNRMDMK